MIQLVSKSPAAEVPSLVPTSKPGRLGLHVLSRHRQIMKRNKLDSLTCFAADEVSTWSSRMRDAFSRVRVACSAASLYPGWHTNSHVPSGRRSAIIWKRCSSNVPVTATPRVPSGVTNPASCTARRNWLAKRRRNLSCVDRFHSVGRDKSMARGTTLRGGKGLRSARTPQAPPARSSGCSTAGKMCVCLWVSK